MVCGQGERISDEIEELRSRDTGLERGCGGGGGALGGWTEMTAWHWRYRGA